jgi:hypothetical protein
MKDIEVLLETREGRYAWENIHHLTSRPWPSLNPLPRLLKSLSRPSFKLLHSRQTIHHQNRLPEFINTIWAVTDATLSIGNFGLLNSPATSHTTFSLDTIVELLTSTITHVRGKKRVAGVMVWIDVDLAPGSENLDSCR